MTGPGAMYRGGRARPSILMGPWMAVPILLAACTGGAGSVPGAAPPTPEREYRLYVANESSDVVSRVVFDPNRGAWVEGEVPVGIMPADTDAPHGLVVSPDGNYWYVTLAHGTPDGWLWKFRTGSDELLSRTTLGRFPASLGTTPDGAFVLVANFDLHGDPGPSSVSVVHTPDLTEWARVTSCAMPHGSRTNASGTRHYHVCMHADQVVELDLATFDLSRRFSVAPGDEGPLPLEASEGVGGHGHEAAAHGPGCRPTWVAVGRGIREDRFVYVACNGDGRVLELDVQEWSVTRTFDVGAGPYNLELSPDGRWMVVTLRGEQAIGIVDLDTGERCALLATSRPIPHGVVVSPDGRYAFVTNESIGGDPGTLDVFDLRALERVASVALRLQPGGLDLWRVDPRGSFPQSGLDPEPG